MTDEKCDALYLLGTGTPTPTKERFGTAYVLKIDDDYLLFDCGPATTYKLVRAGLWPLQINWLFLTHHHFDHNADYPCFLLCRWDQGAGKEKTLQVFGPPPTKDITEKLIGPDGAFAVDWQARVGAPVSQSVHVNRGGSLPRPKPVVDVKDVGVGEITEHGEWKITAERVHHVEPWLESLAYRVDTERGSIVFAGDTGPCEQLLSFAQGSDVFVANCWDHQAKMDDNGEAPGQTGTLDAARFAKETGAKTLVLTHTGPNLCGSRDKGLEDVSAVYDGEIVFGEELMALSTQFRNVLFLAK